MSSPSKIVVITGANSGIGKAAAEILALKGYTIVTICRNSTAGEKTVAALRKLNTSITAENFTLDLSNLQEVRKTGLLIKQKYPVIDRLVNNAGYYPPSIEYINGIEKSFVASHLGHMLLTETLLPSLSQSVEARVINVSSALHSNGKVVRFFKQVPGYNPSNAYGDDKLANILFTIALSKELPPNVTTYSLHPGVVNTNFANTVTGAFKVAITLFSPFFITPEKGAATTAYLVDESIEALRPANGKYFYKKKPVSTKNNDVTEANAISLWSKSKEILKAYV
jgi:retinol dehydrogenase-12